MCHLNISKLCHCWPRLSHTRIPISASRIIIRLTEVFQLWPQKPSTTTHSFVCAFPFANRHHSSYTHTEKRLEQTFETLFTTQTYTLLFPQFRKQSSFDTEQILIRRPPPPCHTHTSGYGQTGCWVLWLKSGRDINPKFCDLRTAATTLHPLLGSTWWDSPGTHTVACREFRFIIYRSCCFGLSFYTAPFAQRSPPYTTPLTFPSLYTYVDVCLSVCVCWWVCCTRYYSISHIIGRMRMAEMRRVWQYIYIRVYVWWVVVSRSRGVHLTLAHHQFNEKPLHTLLDLKCLVHHWVLEIIL